MAAEDPTEHCLHCRVQVRLDRPTGVWWHVVEVPGSSRTSATYLHCRLFKAYPASEAERLGEERLEHQLAARFQEGPDGPEIQSVAYVARQSGSTESTEE